MRVSLKRLLFYVIVGVLIFDIYIFYQVQNDFDHRKTNSSEFLVLDWTGNEHIFKEKDLIKCKDFSFDF